MNGVEKFGPYTVIQSVRLDNPRFPQFTILRGGQIIGRSLSALDLGWCQFVERLNKQGRYVPESPVKRYDYRLAKRGRPTNAARARAAADLLKLPDGA